MWVSEDPTPPENVFQAKAVGERRKWRPGSDMKKTKGKHKDHKKFQSKTEKGEVKNKVMSSSGVDEIPELTCQLVAQAQRQSEKVRICNRPV